MTPGSPRVSVALATFNGARFIAEQLESILNQDEPPSEVVVSDDGSTDETIAIIRETAGAHRLGTVVRVLENGSHLGVTLNFERAIAACAGELIALSDQDDRWHANRLSTAIAAFTADPGLLLVHGDAALIDESGRALGRDLLESLPVRADERRNLVAGRPFGVYIRRNIATGATIVIRRSLLEHALPFPPEWVHDEWLAIIAAAIGGVRVMDEPLIDYRQHGGNEIGMRSPTLRYRVNRMLQSRGSRYVILAARSAVIAERLDQLSVAPEWRSLARAKAEFEARRAKYPVRRLSRIPAVVRDLRAGSYSRLSSQGALDVLRDILQPA